MEERQARDLEVRGSKPGLSSSFSLELKLQFFKAKTIGLYLLVNLMKGIYIILVVQD